MHSNAREKTMIFGAHMVLYSKNADADREALGLHRQAIGRTPSADPVQNARFWRAVRGFLTNGSI
jgi:hypothetical protein